MLGAKKSKALKRHRGHGDKMRIFIATIIYILFFMNEKNVYEE